MSGESARALEFAADHDIIHRNITPNNILVRSSDGCVKLGDLILAKALRGTKVEQITAAGDTVGELAYASPEQDAGGQHVDCRSDIYSLGVALYAMLTGQPPHQGATVAETIAKIRTETPVRPTDNQMAIPALFEDLMFRMLRKNPNDRFQTPTALLNQLERLRKYLAVDS